MIRIAVVDDKINNRKVITDKLSRNNFFTVAFQAVNGEDFLQKISLMNLTSWNYKKQNPQIFRHYGPMAQDFYAAFGKDKYGVIGNDTTINSADFDGVNLIAIQALEKRTQKIQQLETDNTKLQKEVDDLKMRLQKLEAIIQKNQL